MNVVSLIMLLILNSFPPPQKKIIQKFIRIKRCCLGPVFSVGKQIWSIAFSVFCVTDKGLLKKILLLFFISLSLVFFLRWREILFFMLFLNLRIKISYADNEELTSLSSLICYLTTFQLSPMIFWTAEIISNVLIMKNSQFFGILFSLILAVSGTWPLNPFWKLFLNPTPFLTYLIHH